jgi:hypothetical protein
LHHLQKGGDKLGYEAEALAIYDTMRYVKPAVGTVCVGSAYGEAALLLAAGEKVGSCEQGELQAQPEGHDKTRGLLHVECAGFAGRLDNVQV